MERISGMFKAKPNPQEQVREWQRKLRTEVRNVEKNIRGEQNL